MNLLLTKAATKTVSFDNTQIIEVSRLLDKLDSGLETLSDQAKEVIKQLAGADRIYLKEAFEIVRNTLGYRMVSERRETSRTYYDFIKEGINYDI